MATYAVSFSYENERWMSIKENTAGEGGDEFRSALEHELDNLVSPVNYLAEQLEGTVVGVWFKGGPHDGVAILDLPDSASAVAIRAALSAMGNFDAVEIEELFSRDTVVAGVLKFGGREIW